MVDDNVCCREENNWDTHSLKILQVDENRIMPQEPLLIVPIIKFATKHMEFDARIIGKGRPNIDATNVIRDTFPLPEGPSKT